MNFSRHLHFTDTTQRPPKAIRDQVTTLVAVIRNPALSHLRDLMTMTMAPTMLLALDPRSLDLLLVRTALS